MSRLGAPLEQVHAILRAIRDAGPHLRLAGVFLAGVRVLAAGLALAFPLPIASRIA